MAEPSESPNPEYGLRNVALFTVCFLALWTGAWVAHQVLTGNVQNMLLRGDVLVDTAYWAIAKCFVWIAFPLVWVRRITSDPVRYLGLNRAKVLGGVVYGLAASLVFVSVSTAIAYLSGQRLGEVQTGFVVTIYAVVFTPFVEELVFRGYILTCLLNGGVAFWKANLIDAFLFLLPHIVGWSFQGALGTQLLSAGAISIVVISLYIGYVRQRSGSLWGGFLVHAANNLLYKMLR
jgi:membrane protease YdiL (CAAX protease family)